MSKGSSYQIPIEFNGRTPSSAGKAETARKPSLTAVAVLTAPRHSLLPYDLIIIVMPSVTNVYKRL